MIIEINHDFVQFTTLFEQNNTVLKLLLLGYTIPNLTHATIISNTMLFRLTNILMRFNGSINYVNLIN